MTSTKRNADGEPITAASSSSSSSPIIADPRTDLSSYLLSLQSALQPLTRNAALLPSHRDLAFHKSIDRKLSQKLDAEADRLLNSISEITGWIDSHPGSLASTTTTSEKGKRKLVHDDIIAQAFPSTIGDLVDHLLESADTCLDEYQGKIAPRSTANNNNNKDNHNETKNKQDGKSKSLPKTGPLPAKILNAPIPPPQRKFTTKPDNRANVLWSRELKLGKPHAMVPLGHREQDDDHDSALPRPPRRGMYCAEGDPRDNPYHYEIMHVRPPPHSLLKPLDETILPPPPLDADEPQATHPTPYVWVDTADQLALLLAHLVEDRVKEIAIDLEHHNYRSYQGIVCLMQISTRWGDWIVDTLSDEIRQHSETLNLAFTNPNKVKVLHGANHDVLWLQRDLGLYLVNLFDTYHATNTLLFPAHGLNYLLMRYCNFDADKRYQLADWRIRPLPKEMLYYARSDTHSLLYVYDCLCRELYQFGGIGAVEEVFNKSRLVATCVYAKEEWDQEGETREGWKTIYRKWTATETKMDSLEESLVKKLHQWRDTIAREEDESPRYILGASTLMMLATRAPQTQSGVLACLPPSALPLRKRAKELAQIIQNQVQNHTTQQLRKQQDRILSLVDHPVDGGEGEGVVDLGEPVKRSSSSPTTTTTTTTIDLVSPFSDIPNNGKTVNLDLWKNTSLSTTTATILETTTTTKTRSLFGTIEIGSCLFGSRNNPTSTLPNSTTPSLFSSTLFCHLPNSNSTKVTGIQQSFVDQIQPILSKCHSKAKQQQQEQEEQQTSFFQPESIPFHLPPPPTSPPSSKIIQVQDMEEEEEEEQPKSIRTFHPPSSNKPSKKRKTIQQEFDFSKSTSVLDISPDQRIQEDAKKGKKKLKGKK